MEFNPPYFMKSKTAVLFCLKKNRESNLVNEIKGYKPVKIFGRYLGNIILNKYEKPFDDLKPYDEIIYSTVFRKGFKLIYIAEALKLNDKFQVQNGIKYYHLPKCYDDKLKIDLNGKIKFESSTDNFEVKQLCSFFNFILFPLRLLFSLALNIFTKIFPVIGVLKKPFKKAVMHLKPKLVNSILTKIQNLQIDNNKYFIFWGQNWSFVETIVNKPSDF